MSPSGGYGNDYDSDGGYEAGGYDGGDSGVNWAGLIGGGLGFAIGGVPGATAGYKAGTWVGEKDFGGTGTAPPSTTPGAPGVGGDYAGTTAGLTGLASLHGGSAVPTATGAYQTQVSAEQQALDYLMQREAIPQQLREGALTQLGGLYGLGGGVGDRQAFIDQARMSPLYQSIMSGKQAGEEVIMRQAGATGGLRSGNVQHAMYDYNTRLQNKALLESYNQQLSGLAGLAQLPSGAQQIATGMAGIGATQATGMIGAGQTAQAESQQKIDTLMGVASIPGVVPAVESGVEALGDWFVALF